MEDHLGLANLLKLKAVFRRYDSLPEHRKQELQLLQLRRIARHAFKHTAYYNESWRKADVTPNDIRSLADLSRLPLLTKADVMANPGAFCANNYTGLCHFKTATSETRFEFDARSVAIAKVKSLLALSSYFKRSGLRSGIRALAMVNGQEIGASMVPPGPVIEHMKILSYARNREQCFSEMDAFQPHAIFAYPSFLSDYARHIQQGGEQAGVRLVVACGEIVDNKAIDEWRNTFGAEVVCQYGATESLCRIATSCPEMRLHVDASLFALESVAIGKAMHLILTSLFNYRMPLIRYDIGDLGEVIESDCPCGARSPVIVAAQGRLSESLCLPDGRLVPAAELLDVMRPIPGLIEWQVVQEGNRSVRFDLVCGEAGCDMRSLVASRVREGIARINVTGMDVKVQPVQRIEPEPNGKKRLVVQNDQAARAALSTGR